MKHCLSLVLFAISTIAVTAQPAPEADTEKDAAALMFFRHQLRAHLADPSLESPVLTPRFSFNITEQDGSKTATAFAGWLVCRNEENCLEGDPPGLHVKLTAPLGKAQKSISLVSLRGLQGKTTAEVGFKWTNAQSKIRKNGPTSSQMQGAIVNAMTARPASAGRVANALPAEDRGEIETRLMQFRAAPRQRNQQAALSEQERASLRQTIDPLMRSVVRAALDDPETTSRSEVVNEMSYLLHDSDAPDFDKVWAVPYLLAATYTVARPGFDYADSTTFEEKSETHNTYAASAFFGITPMRGVEAAERYYLGVSYTRKTDYEAQDAENLCSPLSGGNINCREIAIGAPERKHADVIELEYRQFFRHVGWNPKAAYDLENEVGSFELPLYLRQDANKPFAGGVRVLWTEDKGFSAAAFIAMAPTLKLP